MNSVLFWLEKLSDFWESVVSSFLLTANHWQHSVSLTYFILSYCLFYPKEIQMAQRISWSIRYYGCISGYSTCHECKINLFFFRSWMLRDKCSLLLFGVRWNWYMLIGVSCKTRQLPPGQFQTTCPLSPPPHTPFPLSWPIPTQRISTKNNPHPYRPPSSWTIPTQRIPAKDNRHPCRPLSSWTIPAQRIATKDNCHPCSIQLWHLPLRQHFSQENSQFFRVENVCFGNCPGVVVWNCLCSCAVIS